MFILTIMPLPLSANADGVLPNRLNPLDVIEDKIMGLEHALSSLLLNSGIGESDQNISSIQKELDAARNEELKIKSQMGLSVSFDALTRVSEIQAQKSAVQQRIKDIEKLKSEYLKTPDANMEAVSGLTYEVSDLDQYGNPITKTTTDLAAINNALEAARAFEIEIEKANKFWSQIVNSHNEQERPAFKRQKGDINGDGKINKADVRMLQNAIDKKIQLTSDQQIAADINDDKKIDKNDIQALKKKISDGVKPVPKSYLGQIEHFTNQIIELMNNPKIKNKSAVTFLKEKLFKALRRYTNQPVTGAKKDALNDFFKKITKGDSPDSNMDGKIDFNDVINIWNNAGISPRSTENK